MAEFIEPAGHPIWGLGATQSQFPDVNLQRAMSPIPVQLLGTGKLQLMALQSVLIGMHSLKMPVFTYSQEYVVEAAFIACGTLR